MVDDHILVVSCEGVEVRDHFDLPAVAAFANAIVLSDIQRQLVLCGQTHGVAAGERHAMRDVSLVVAAYDDVRVRHAGEQPHPSGAVLLDGLDGRPTWARHEVAAASRRASRRGPRCRSPRRRGAARTPGR